MIKNSIYQCHLFYPKLTMHTLRNKIVGSINQWYGTLRFLKKLRDTYRSADLISLFERCAVATAEVSGDCVITKL